MKLIFVSALLLFVSACLWDQECKFMPFDELNSTAYILLNQDFDWGEARIDDPEKLAAIIDSIERIPGRWADPWYGAPVGGFGAIFYDSDERRINEYRLTKKRAELFGCGNEQYIRIKKLQREFPFSAIGMPENYSNKKKTYGTLDCIIDFV